MSRRFALFLILTSTLAITWPWIGRPFTTRGEAREAIVVEQMLETGNWLLPRVYDGAVPSKPPLLHWVGSFFNLAYIGEVPNEALLRAASAIGPLLFSVFFLFFLMKRVAAENAVISSLILLTSLDWFRGQASFRVDPLFSSLFAGALLSSYVWWEKGLKGVPLLASLLIALAALTKGPVALVLPPFIFTAFLFLRRELTLLKFFRSSLLIIPGVLTLAFWYLGAWLEGHDDFLNKVWYENVERFASATDDKPHAHSVPFLLGMLFLGLLPWSLVIGEKLFRVFPRSWDKAKGAPRDLWASWEKAPALLQFSSLSAFLIFLFFSIPSSKRGEYLLPSYPFFAILISVLPFSTSMLFRRTIRYGAFFYCFAGALISVLGTIAVFYGKPILAYASLDSGRGAWLSAIEIGRYLLTNDGVISLLTVLGFALVALHLLKNISESPRLYGATAVTALIVSLNALVQGSVGTPLAQAVTPKQWARHDLKTYLSKNSKPNDWFYSYGSELYALSFYLNRDFKRITEAIPESGLVFMEARVRDQFVSQLRFWCEYEEASVNGVPLAAKRSKIVLLKLRKNCLKVIIKKER